MKQHTAGYSKGRGRGHADVASGRVRPRPDGQRLAAATMRIGRATSHPRAEPPGDLSSATLAPSPLSVRW